MRPNLQDTENLVTFTEEILNGKLCFLCSDIACQVTMVIISDASFCCNIFFSYSANLDTFLIIDAYVFFLLSSLLGE